MAVKFGIYMHVRYLVLSVKENKYEKVLVMTIWSYVFVEAGSKYRGPQGFYVKIRVFGKETDTVFGVGMQIGLNAWL